MRNETAVNRCEDASQAHSISSKTEPCSFCFGKLLECLFVLAPLLLLVSSSVCGADDKLLWKIQKVLASKKYVDLTHAFAPGIPRWPGFPDETRKTIYWYDKRPDTMGSGFFSELFPN